ncbi:MAG TPA: DUF2277 domain-containing protein [Anaerolineales bacterium]|jgi:hypothetical protein
MCRSIKQLRHPDGPVTDQELYEAALQYVRKVSGYRKPSRANSAVFEAAVLEIAGSTRQLLAGLAQPGEPSTVHTH